MTLDEAWERLENDAPEVGLRVIRKHRPIIEAAIRASEPLDVERLAGAIVKAFRDEAQVNWPWLRGDGWPAYSEHRQPEQVMNVDLITKRIAREYAALGEKGNGS